MTDASFIPPPPLERIQTGVAGLDMILHGGLLRGGSYIVLGRPGSGKTILGNQFAFQVARTGQQAIYLTLMAESHGRMLAHMASMSFFDPSVVAQSLYYVSGQQALAEGGLRGLLDFIRSLVRARRPSLLVIDGANTANEMAGSTLELKRYLHELVAFMAAAGCTTVFLTHTSPGAARDPEHTVVDGVIELSQRLDGQRLIRELSVTKFRGSSYLDGAHSFQITNDGLIVYPRTEALLSAPPAYAGEQRQRLSFGVSGLDEMLHGGLLSGSSTLLLGPPGSGKTLLGLHFLAQGAATGESVLHFGFFETPPRFIQKAEAIGLPFGAYLREGQLGVVWQPPLEQLLDAMGERLLRAVREQQVRRLFIDGLDGFRQASSHSPRVGLFFTALIHELRALDVTTLITAEVSNLFGPEVHIPVEGLAEQVDNILFLRHVEYRSALHHFISILKIRESEYDPRIRRFIVGANGVTVTEPFMQAEGLLTGVARHSEDLPAMSGVQTYPEAGPSGTS